MATDRDLEPLAREVSSLSNETYEKQFGHASAKTTLDRHGHLMPNLENDAARRLDKTVFGNSVRKLLENPVSEGNPAKKRTSEVIDIQRFKLGSGEGI